MGSEIALWMTDIFGSGAGEVIAVIFLSMLPVLERGSIPLAFAFGFNWWTAMALSIFGGILPIPFILLFLESIFNFMQKHNIFGNLVEKLNKKAALRNKKIEKYKFFGLIILVGLPLPIPGTGGWTAALIASVLKMNKRNAFLSIFIGVIIAATIVATLTYGLVGYFIKK